MISFTCALSYLIFWFPIGICFLLKKKKKNPWWYFSIIFSDWSEVTFLGHVLSWSIILQQSLSFSFPFPSILCEGRFDVPFCLSLIFKCRNSSRISSWLADGGLKYVSSHGHLWPVFPTSNQSKSWITFHSADISSTHLTKNQLPANLGHSVTWNSLILLRLTFKNSVAQMVKHPPAMWESLVRSLGWEDPLSRAWQPTQVFLPGVSPWTEEPGRLKSIKSQRVRHDWTQRFLRLLERFEVSSLAGGNRH